MSSSMGKSAQKKILDIIQPNEIIYADDVNFISMEKHRDVDKIQEVLHRHHLKVNTEKKQNIPSLKETWMTGRKAKKQGRKRGHTKEKGPGNEIPEQTKQTLE